MNLEMTIRTSRFKVLVSIICAIAIAMVDGQMMNIVILAFFAKKFSVVALHCENKTTSSVVSVSDRIQFSTAIWGDA
jgi:hypothetical protein